MSSQQNADISSEQNAEIPISSASVVMLSPPDSEDFLQDVFHTPPEDSLLPSSDVDIHLSTVNQLVDSGGFSDCSEYMDLEKDSDLGVSDARLKRVTGKDSVSESPEKKLKLGFESLVDDQINAVNEDDICKEIEMDENSVPRENVERNVNFMVDEEVIEGSGMRERGDEERVRCMLPNSIASLSEKTTAKESESGKVEEKNKFSVFDVLKVLAEEEKRRKRNEFDGISMMEAANLAGVKFPRPSYWPIDYNSKLFYFDDQVKKSRK